ncbi:MAG: protein-glutamate O-methyltransferase CheR [Phycisphaerae bacterium]
MQLATLTESEFALFAKFVYDWAGIYLAPEKRTLLSNRLRQRLKALSLDSFRAYYDRFRDDQFADEELPNFLSAVTTNETYFFRNERLWELVGEKLIPEFVQRNGARSRSIKVWSAASSSGEEAYTAAILLRERVPDFDRWRISVIGTDISKKVLEKARAGIYNEYAVAKMSDERRERLLTVEGDKFRVKDEIRKLVRFEFHNLRDPLPTGGYDLVLLRNVLMYFDTAMKQQAIEVTSQAVAPGGYLFIGDVDPTRTSPELMSRMKLEIGPPGLYRRPVQTPALASTAS